MDEINQKVRSQKLKYCKTSNNHRNLSIFAAENKRNRIIILMNIKRNKITRK